MNIKHLIAAFSVLAAFASSSAQNNIAEEVAWVIGDEPIYKSDIEKAYKDMLQSREPVKGDPYCVIPEELALNRLFLHQADIDTVEVQEAMIQQQADQQMNYLISELGSREKVEQYLNMPFSQYRDYVVSSMRDRSRIMQVRHSLVKDLKITPSDVRRYYSTLPQDSIPLIPLEVEVQIVTLKPLIPREEIDNVKARLREYSDRVNKGESEFSTLAILYSEDPGSSVRGGEMGFMGRGEFVPEFAAVAFNLNDPKKVSKIVETEYGFHIIQLIEKRGDRINARHILLKPKAERYYLKPFAGLEINVKTFIDERSTINIHDISIETIQKNIYDNKKLFEYDAKNFEKYVFLINELNAAMDNYKKR